MNLLTSLVFLTTISVAYQQCFTKNDNFGDATYSTDLSGITGFGLDLYKQLAPGSSPKNFFFSPYSIWSAFIMAYFGSGGNTQRQLESALRVSDKISTIKLWKALERFYELRQENSTQYTFNLANRAYFHNTLNLRSCPRTILHNELRVVDFRDIVSSANEINNFASETTKGRINRVVTPEDIVDAVMVLVNAAFFKGTWKYQFKPSNTKRMDFFINAQDTAKLAMMSQKGTFRYGESRELGARVLELPYSGDAISMFVLMPSADRPRETRFENMVRNLNGATLTSALHPRNMAFRTVDVQFPKFKFSMKLGEDLETALKNLGIVDLFDGKLANMTVFARFEDLSVDKVIHKSFIEVNEEGTEAAAVTAIISLTRSSIGRTPEVIRFHCNEPFIFLIHDNETRNVLFMGAIKNPRG